jgi:hypothetical protein
MGFVPGSAPGTPGNMLGGPAFSTGLGNSGGSDATFDLPSEWNVGPHLSLRQVAMGGVGGGSFDPSPGNHSAGIGDPQNDSLGWLPCMASFTRDTLPGSLLVCLGIITADNFGGELKPEILAPTFGLDLWGPDAPGGPRSIFSAGLACTLIGGQLFQVPQAAGGLAYRMNAPIVPAGQAFYGGLFSADWCNNFAYQMVLVEFECDNATQTAFSFNNTLAPAGGSLNILTGRLPSDNGSFVISVTWSNPDGGAQAGPGFNLGELAPLGLRWQWQEFPAQPSGYAGPQQWPSVCPGLSGSFDLGFSGGAFSSVTPVGAFVWNLLPTTPTEGGGGGGDVNEFLPNVWVNT